MCLVQETGYWDGVGHWKCRHRRKEYCLLMTAVCKGGYNGNVGTAVAIGVGDCDYLGDGAILSGRLNPPLLRAVEVGSSSNSLFTETTQTHIQKPITQTALIHLDVHLLEHKISLSIQYFSLKYTLFYFSYGTSKIISINGDNTVINLPNK